MDRAIPIRHTELRKLFCMKIGVEWEDKGHAVTHFNALSGGGIPEMSRVVHYHRTQLPAKCPIEPPRSGIDQTYPVGERTEIQGFNEEVRPYGFSTLLDYALHGRRYAEPRLLNRISIYSPTGNKQGHR
jgi:hypothetical protein